MSVLWLAGFAVAESPTRLTILYDSFGKNPAPTMDWGFAALIEYGGKRIFFDTGGNAGILAHNVSAKNVDLTRLDFVVMSHRPRGPYGWISARAEGQSTCQNLCAKGQIRSVRR